MGLLKQVIAEMDPNMAPYGGIVGLDAVDKLKNNPKADAVPFTRYLTQRSSAEGEEQAAFPDRSQGKNKLAEIVGSLYNMETKSADAVIYGMIKQNKLSIDEFTKLLTMYNSRRV